MAVGASGAEKAGMGATTGTKEAGMRAATADQRGGGSDGAQQTAWRRQGRRRWAPRPVALQVRVVDKVGGEVLRFEIKWLAAQTWGWAGCLQQLSYLIPYFKLHVVNSVSTVRIPNFTQSVADSLPIELLAHWSHVSSFN